MSDFVCVTLRKDHVPGLFRAFNSRNYPVSDQIYLDHVTDAAVSDALGGGKREWSTFRICIGWDSSVLLNIRLNPRNEYVRGSEILIEGLENLFVETDCEDIAILAYNASGKEATVVREKKRLPLSEIRVALTGILYNVLYTIHRSKLADFYPDRPLQMGILGSIGRAQVWLGELPNVDVNEDLKVQCDELTAGESKLRDTSAAVEVFKRDSLVCGLIGGTFMPNGSGRLRVNLYSGSGMLTSVPWSLAAPYDTILAGISAELTTAVCNGIRASRAPQKLGAGLLTINRVAHGSKGRLPRHFLQLTEALIGLIASDVQSPHLVQEIVASAFSKRR
jgi:hypothetical protein